MSKKLLSLLVCLMLTSCASTEPVRTPKPDAWLQTELSPLESLPEQGATMADLLRVDTANNETSALLREQVRGWVRWCKSINVCEVQ